MMQEQTSFSRDARGARNLSRDAMAFVLAGGRG